MRRIAIFIAIAFQFLTLAYMAGQREYRVRVSPTVYLRTAPIDPRDIFRGDFVRLEYDISTIPEKKLKGNLKNHKHRKGLEVYTVLKKGDDGLTELSFCTDEKPTDQLFIKGRITDNWRLRIPKDGIAVKYGIETYFVEQGKGIQIENKRGFRNDIQTPLEMEVALGTDGTAILKGHRWSPLGMGLMMTNPDASDPSGRKSSVVHLKLANTSDQPLALVMLPDNRSFSLEPVKWAQSDWQPAHPAQSVIPSDADVIILKPSETWQTDLDMTNPRWFVRSNGSATETGLLPMTDMFRFVYRPPDASLCQHLKDSHLIWHGYLPSRAFHGRGGFD